MPLQRLRVRQVSRRASRHARPQRLAWRRPRGSQANRSASSWSRSAPEPQRFEVVPLPVAGPLTRRDEGAEGCMRFGVGSGARTHAHASEAVTIARLRSGCVARIGHSPGGRCRWAARYTYTAP